jgi:hypothetical protein
MVREFSLGGMTMTGDSLGRLMVMDTKSMNDFGKKMDYHNDDEIVSLDGKAINLNNANMLIQTFYTTVKEGDMVKVGVKRKTAQGQMELVTLSASAMKVEKEKLHQLKFDDHADPKQLALRKVWLNTGE